ncbi:MAG: DNA-3-methyladenine glycosylase [Chloroherpetonaceae bacterium]|nr:DNA-3-methyladenine glycosylase [Chthonomonadaceae bacterium]MDW8207812.1 DNA-3-methyladenine glycosylase [Chloroherpetonaceae bacterium]
MTSMEARTSGATDPAAALEAFGAPLSRDFYRQDAVQLAPMLLNCILVHETAEGIRAGRITETEAYTQDEPACHAFRGRTLRNAVMFGPPGHAYIYFTYGMHHCMNAVSGPEGRGEAVLIRAVEPLVGLEQMLRARGLPAPAPGAALTPAARVRLGRALCGGPGRLCQAFGLDRTLNGDDLTRRPRLWIAPPGVSAGFARPESIVASPRIGISAGTDLLWRFTLRDDPYTSR